MVKSEDCLEKWGDPTPEFERSQMTVWSVPDDIHILITPLPKKIYLNKLMLQPLWNAFLLVIDRGLEDKIDEWGGCFAIRKMRNGSSFSLHSWGIAFDINISTNQLYAIPQMDPRLVACFHECGFDWGGFWHPRTDGMHFQLSEI